MRIAIIASHAWPLPSPARTGDSFIILDLSRSLAEMGHEVELYAPYGTVAPPGVLLVATGQPTCFEAFPTANERERRTLGIYEPRLSQSDIIHDCSVNKTIHAAFPAKSLATIWGGPWRHTHAPRNVIAQSHAQRERLLRGATDYEGTATPDAGGPNGTPLKDCRVVWNGTDTDVHKPSGRPKQDFFLMLNRWHPVRGTEQGIELAKATGINLLIAGTDPAEDHPAQAEYALKMCDLARGCDNISIEFLPPGEAHRERIVELYQDAKALLFLPQFQEPFGLSQIEAMACGTGVIATRMGSTFEVLGGSELLPDWVPEGWLYSHSDEQWNRGRALVCFDRRVMATNYVKLYEEVAGGGGWG